jgi:hypothetical protein
LRRSDFTWHDVLSSVFRALVAVPFGFSLTQIMQPDAAMPLAFLLGTFPTGTLLRVGRRVASQRFALGEEDNLANELEKLQGLAKSRAERLADQGITTIQQLAWADPLDLAIRTNASFNDVVDWVSQALLWVYFEEKVRALYKLGLRGAQEVAALFDTEREAKQILSAKPSASEKQKADADLLQVKDTIAQAAKALDMPEAAVRTTLQMVDDDPYAQFLYSVWN